MVFVSGSRSSVREHGYVLELTCTRCKTAGWWKLVEEKDIKTVYYVPVMSDSRFHIYCAKCGYSVLLNEDQARRAFYLRDSVLQLSNQQIPAEEYMRRVQECRYLQ